MAYGFIGAKDLQNSFCELENDIKNELLLSNCNNMVTKRFGYDYYSIQSAIKKIAQQGDAPEPDSRRSCLLNTTSRPGDL